MGWEEHIMNRFQICRGPPFGLQASRERRDGRGKNVVPPRRVAVERREAPHPSVIGVRVPSPRRAAGRVMVRQGVPLRTRRLPALHFPRPRGSGKMGRARPAPESRSPGRRSIGYLTSESDEPVVPRAARERPPARSPDGVIARLVARSRNPGTAVPCCKSLNARSIFA
jgi:hypothetical protein